MKYFKDLKVLELATVLAGPSVGQFFAELGADVIKVESVLTGGDVTRSWKLSNEQTDDRSAYFCSVNWGKRSIAIDLNKENDRTIIHQLARHSDILIASYKPGDATKLQVDYETICALNPKIIYGQITGYGSNNPRVGYDAVIQAEAGFMFMNGEPGGPSLKMPVALIDILAGHHLKEAILLALLNRQLTNEGGFVEVSLIQAAISSLANQATNWLVAGKLPQKQGSAHPNIAPYGDVFKTGDGYEILFAIGNNKQFNELCSILAIPEISSSADFITNVLRVQNRVKLTEILQRKVSEFNAAELIARIHAANIPAGLIQNLAEVFKLQEAQDLLFHSPTAGLRSFAAKGNFFENADVTPPPQFGQHTSEILNELSLL